MNLIMYKGGNLNTCILTMLYHWKFQDFGQMLATPLMELNDERHSKHILQDLRGLEV